MGRAARQRAHLNTHENGTHRKQAEVAVRSIQAPAGLRSSRQPCGNIQRLESNHHTDVSAGRGRWARALFLTPGRYGYALVVDGRVISNPATDGKATADSGGVDSVLVV